MLSDVFDRLAEYPDSGSARPSFGIGIRAGVVEPYIAFYRYNESNDTVSIVRVLHSSRRITRKLLKV